MTKISLSYSRITFIMQINILHCFFLQVLTKIGTFIIIAMRLPVYFRQWTELCGAACITASADDMAKFMNFLLNGGKTESGDRKSVV